MINSNTAAPIFPCSNQALALSFRKPNSPNRPTRPNNPQLLPLWVDCPAAPLPVVASTFLTPESPLAMLLLSANVPVPVPDTVAAPGAPWL